MGILHLVFRMGLIACCGLFAACVRPGAPPPPREVPNLLTRHWVEERFSGVMVVPRADLGDWPARQLNPHHVTEDIDGGSAAPISPDGYFLTADHVLARVSDGWHPFVLYGRGSQLKTARARVVWRSAAADLALLHAPIETPHYYAWTAPGRWLANGTWVIHGGIATGRRTPPGKLATHLAPEGPLTGARKFKLDFPLKPGDSGGPVVDAGGGLIGVNSAVEFLVPIDTAFFVDSEGSRPNVRQLMKRIERDRTRNTRPAGNVP